VGDAVVNAHAIKVEPGMGVFQFAQEEADRMAKEKEKKK
jgi:hypothetical protein